MIMKQSKEKFDFKAFGQAIKAARKTKGLSRNQLADKLNIAPRYIASIENSGQHPSLQILYELVTLLDVSVDQFFFPEREQEKSTRRRQLDTMLDTMSETDLKIMVCCAVWALPSPFACRITAAICFFSARVSLRLFPAVSRVFFVCPFDNR